MKQTICLGMIVRNEARIIKECLDSIVNYIDYWVISDTGSSDDTINIIKNYFKEKNIPGELIERSWVNFGHNRTEVFEYAYGKSDYFLTIDADDTFIGNTPFPYLDKDAYFLKINHGNMVYFRKQLFKNSIRWKSIGVTHEYAESPDGKTFGNLDGYSIKCSARLSNRRGLGKEQDDIRLLLAGIKDEPDNSRYYFYLAQTYRDAGQYLKAIETYNKRANMGGFEEEVFYSLYQNAECIMKLPEYPGAFDEILKLCIRAYEIRPERAESIYILTRYCRLTGRYKLGYGFGKIGLEIPYPKSDILFINDPVYNYKLLDETAVCASWLNKPEETISLYKKALASNKVSEADRERIQTNILKWKKILNRS